MKCYKHISEDIVVQCHGCGRGLCHGCSGRFNLVFCEGCLLKNNNEYRKQTLKGLLLSGAIFLVAAYFLHGQIKDYQPSTLLTILITSYIFASVPWGWSFLSRITPQVFLMMPIIGWAVFFVVKLYLSLFVGMFIAPYKIFRAIKDLKEVRETELSTQVEVI